jgi:hypothetical protein
MLYLEMREEREKRVRRTVVGAPQKTKRRD